MTKGDERRKEKRGRRDKSRRNEKRKKEKGAKEKGEKERVGEKKRCRYERSVGLARSWLLALRDAFFSLSGGRLRGQERERNATAGVSIAMREYQSRVWEMPSEMMREMLR